MFNKNHTLTYTTYLRKYQRLLNLMYYELLEVVLKELEDDDQFVLSETLVNPENKWITIYVNKEWTPTDEQLNRTALHEMLEVLLWDLRASLLKRYCWDTVVAMVHRVIRTMENIILANH